MFEGKIVKITPMQHNEWLKNQIKEKGLYYAVKEQLDDLVDICHPLGYLGFSEATERAMNILDLIEVFGQKYGIYRVEQSDGLKHYDDGSAEP